MSSLSPAWSHLCSQSIRMLQPTLICRFPVLSGLHVIWSTVWELEPGECSGGVTLTVLHLSIHSFPLLSDLFHSLVIIRLYSSPCCRHVRCGHFLETSIPKNSFSGAEAQRSTDLKAAGTTQVVLWKSSHRHEMLSTSGKHLSQTHNLALSFLELLWNGALWKMFNSPRQIVFCFNGKTAC